MGQSKNIPESTKVERRKADLVRTYQQAKSDRRRGGEVPSAQKQRYIGVYRVDRRLAKGGMGEVFLAFDERLGRPVAIKQIRGDKTFEGKRKARLRREARAVARLSHPAIAQVHDVVYDDEGYSIVMEYVEGQNIAELLARGEISGGLAINVAIQVTQGLAAAHNLGMVHRDLKAENVMVTPDGFAKILDFGLVKKTSPDTTRESLTERGFLLGTVASMSPEQATGQKVDARSDLFSLGILLYEMFTGYSPFRRERWLESLEHIKNAHQTPANVVRPELPVELASLIDWLLKKDPKKRPQNTRQVVDILAEIAATTRVGELSPPRIDDADLETLPIVSTDLQPAAVSLTPTVSAEPPPSTSTWEGWARRLNPSFLSLSFLAVVAVALLAWKMFFAEEPLRVLVLEPGLRTVPTENTGDYEHLTSIVLMSTLQALGDLESVLPVDPSEAERSSGTSAEQAQQAGVPEALDSSLFCRDGECQISFRRVRAADGLALGSTKAFRILAESSDPAVLDATVEEKLRGLYAPPSE